MSWSQLNNHNMRCVVGYILGESSLKKALTICFRLSPLMASSLHAPYIYLYCGSVLLLII